MSKKIKSYDIPVKPMDDYKQVHLIMFLKKIPNDLQEQLIKKEVQYIMGKDYIRSYISDK